METAKGRVKDAQEHGQEGGKVVRGRRRNGVRKVYRGGGREE